MLTADISDTHIEQQQPAVMKLEVPPQPVYVGLVRLTMAAFASRCGFDVEAIEDIKIAVAEAVTNAIIHGKHIAGLGGVVAQCRFAHNSIIIQVSDQGCGFEESSLCLNDIKGTYVEGGLGLFIIRSLMDEVELKTKPGEGTRVIMTKYLGEY